MDILEQMNLKNRIEKVLHTPYNYKGGMLEFAIVFDYHMTKEYIVSTGKGIHYTLTHSSL